MCRRIECSKCGKPTYTGCGAHVEQVLGNVPPAERCRCHESKSAQTDSKAGSFDPLGFIDRVFRAQGR